MWWNKIIAYTTSYKKTLIVGLILGACLPIIILFLAPFDSEQYDASYKTLRISGYGLTILVGVLLLHSLENLWYRRQNCRWTITSELLFVLPGFLILVSLCCLYNFYIINSLSGFTVGYYLSFMKNFGLPFAPLLLPLWLYLRANFGEINLGSTASNASKQVVIYGDNKSEQLILEEASFVFAQAQQNYVTIYHVKNNELQSAVLRSTLYKIHQQLPQAWQIHRSYLVNLAHITTVTGNSRKRELELGHFNKTIPLSQKYYVAIKKHLSASSL
ncbi:MAG: LytTR family DNA-binding domain-containing protein [Gilvibacter sp.]